MPTNSRSELANVDFAQLASDIASLERENAGSQILNVLREQSDMKAHKHSLSRDLEATEKRLIESFLGNSDALLSLYQETKDCETILNSMESTLGEFADSLRGVSDEIRTLQHKSEELSDQLKSRSETQEQLIGYIDSVVVSPDLVGIICEHEDCGSDKFLSAIEQLGSKLRSHALLDQDLPAVSDSGPELQKLKTKAIFRIRDFLASKIHSLKQPKTNVQILQRNVLVKLVPLVKFLKETDGGFFFTEIVALYAANMSKLYLGQFKTYVQSLARLQMETIAGKSDVLGALEGQQAESLDLVSRLKGSTSGVKGNVFSISGGRDRVVKQDIDSDCIVVAAESSGAKYYLESLLRSHQKLLADTASSEFLFLSDFFDISENLDERHRFFNAVFDKTLAWLADHVVTAHVREAHDAVGLMLSVRIIEYFQDLMINKRKIGVLDAYFEGLLVQLRLRLRLVIEANTDSLRKVDVKKISPLPAANAPFYITRRFAEFVAAILVVKSELVEDSHLTHLVDSLVTVFEAFISGLSKRFSASVEQQIFSLNNFDLVVSVLREHNVIATPLGTRYSEKMSLFVSVLVEERLRAHFGALIKLTTDGEKLVSVEKLSLQDCERTVLLFQQHWKSEIAALQKEIFETFANLSTAAEVLKNAMTQLLLYYTRFQTLVQQRLGTSPPPAWTRQIVPSAVIMAEIKQIQGLF